MNIRKQHFLICAELILRTEEGISAQKANGVLIQSDIKVNAMGIGKSQQAVQIAFMSKLPEADQAKIQIIDVIVLSITHLGEFTEEEWRHVPANLQLVKSEPQEFVADPTMTIDQLVQQEQVSNDLENAEVQSDRA